MNVTCPNCATVYRVDPAKVPDAGVRARCAVCSAVFPVRRDGQPSRAPEPVATAAPVREPVAPAPMPEPPRPAPPSGESVRLEPSRAEPPRAEPSRAEPPRAEPGAPPVRPSAPEPPRPAAPAGPVRPAATSASPTPAGGPPRPAAPVRPGPAVAPASAVASAPAPPSASPTPPPASPARPAAGRPANPFLSQDPSLKARRLARALISDMVVYHPAKRQEGLRDGNLKELFEEEIKKSWEEYADQVGRSYAESTTFFREALNEILAGGRQVF